MKLSIENIIETSEDGVKYFPLCKKCMDSAEVIGLGIFIDPDKIKNILFFKNADLWAFYL